MTREEFEQLVVLVDSEIVRANNAVDPNAEPESAHEAMRALTDVAAYARQADEALREIEAFDHDEDCPVYAAKLFCYLEPPAECKSDHMDVGCICQVGIARDARLAEKKR